MGISQGHQQNNPERVNVHKTTFRDHFLVEMFCDGTFPSVFAQFSLLRMKLRQVTGDNFTYGKSCFSSCERLVCLFSHLKLCLNMLFMITIFIFIILRM